MKENEDLVFSGHIIKDILVELKNVSLMTDDVLIREKMEEIISTLNKGSSLDKEISVADMIYEKMQETKKTNEDLHFNLYMLYRKLQDGKISDSDAMAVFKNYVRL